MTTWGLENTESFAFRLPLLYVGMAQRLHHTNLPVNLTIHFALIQEQEPEILPENRSNPEREINFFTASDSDVTPLIPAFSLSCKPPRSACRHHIMELWGTPNWRPSNFNNNRYKYKNIKKCKWSKTYSFCLFNALNVICITLVCSMSLLQPK